jgi:hypothetical protein
MKKKPETSKDAAEKLVETIRRKTRQTLGRLHLQASIDTRLWLQPTYYAMSRAVIPVRHIVLQSSVDRYCLTILGLSLFRKLPSKASTNLGAIQTHAARCCRITVGPRTTGKVPTPIYPRKVCADQLRVNDPPKHSLRRVSVNYILALDLWFG